MSVVACAWCFAQHEAQWMLHYVRLQMVVPTADTVRFAYLLETCLDVGRSVLFAGITGVGKSVITGAALQSMASRSGCPPADATSGRVAGRLVAHTAVFSAQTSSSDVRYLIESKLDKKRKKRCVKMWWDATRFS
jgi:dynein heavy chain